MALFAETALRAFNQGKTSEQFRVAAQRNANAFWVYAIIGGIVWYFASWKWALIPFGLAAWVMLQSFSATMIADKVAFWEKRVEQ